MAWIRLPGSANRYRNTDSGTEISRRQYDKLYGRLAGNGFTSYERQAKANREKDIEEALARPARARRSLVRYPKQSPERQARVVNARAAALERKHKHGIPNRVSNNMLPKKQRGIRFSLPFDYKVLEDWLRAASKNPAIIGFGVGIEGINTATNQPMQFTTYGAVLLSDYESNPERLMERIEVATDTRIEEISYLVVTGLFVWFTWSIDWLRRYRNWKD